MEKAHEVKSKYLKSEVFSYHAGLVSHCPCIKQLIFLKNVCVFPRTGEERTSLSLQLDVCVTCYCKSNSVISSRI